MAAALGACLDSLARDESGISDSSSESSDDGPVQVHYSAAESLQCARAERSRSRRAGGGGRASAAEWRTVALAEDGAAAGSAPQFTQNGAAGAPQPATRADAVRVQLRRVPCSRATAPLQRRVRRPLRGTPRLVRGQGRRGGSGLAALPRSVRGPTGDVIASRLGARMGAYISSARKRVRKSCAHLVMTVTR